ncbi:MAG: PIG-L deacetylase family protein [Elusimicrobiota bacterium]|nr:PIG-L deacetylase family protein [Elusimicrobiota bacterium]
MRLKYINISKFYSAVQPYLKVSVTLAHKFPKKKIFVVSPHIDDDILGAGGSIHKHISSGGEVSVVYLAGSDKPRIEEANQVQRIINYKKIHFWEYQSDKIEHHNEIVDSFREILLEEKPEIVLVPFLVDNHRDHIATNKFLAESINQNKFEFDIFSYEIWSPLYPNFMIDISDTIEIKKECISMYKSQLKDHEYIDQSVSLNRFRGATFRKNSICRSIFLLNSRIIYITL